MPISNPATYHIDGNNTKKFTYETGPLPVLFHFSPNDNHLSTYMNMNLVLYANSEQHGLNILVDMFDFGIQCRAEYIVGKSPSGPHAKEFLAKAENDMAEYVKYKEAILAGKVKLTVAPTNQVYKVGWAANDTI